jgi:L-ribulose-5-phosphate 3-epimerase
VSPAAVPRHSIGIMQGRLVPPTGGRVQSFPAQAWEAEFPLAAEIGFASIELTIETASLAIHPLLSLGGRERLAHLCRENGIALAGLCCDVFMETALTAPEAAAAARPLLRRLLETAAEAGLPMIELPMLGVNSLREGPPMGCFAAALDEALPIAERLGVDILLEADLAPDAFAALLARFPHPRLGINYDSGNSTYFGFDAAEELATYVAHVRNVHVKDCTPKDYSVPLGQGETRFDVIFDRLARAGYSGGFILQAARQADDIGAARDYLEYTRRLIARWLRGGSPAATRMSD